MKIYSTITLTIINVVLFLLFSNIPAGICQTTLIPSGAVWLYLDDGSDQDTIWRANDFDDTSWAFGPAQLGYGDGDETTIVSYGSDPDNKYVTTYFRHSFAVNDPTQYVGLLLRLLRDDGAVIYLNGVEIERSNMPTHTITYLTLSSTTVGGTEENMIFESYEDIDNIRQGTNVLAVEIHQRSLTSSDISFDFELVGLTEFPELTRKAPYLIYTGSNTEMKVVWQTTFSASGFMEWGGDTTYSLGNTATYEYGNGHQHSYTITQLSPDNEYYYRVTVDDEIHTGSFRTAPLENETEVKFLAYGDTRSNPSAHNSVANRILTTLTEDEDFQSLIISMGDLVYNGDNEYDWDSQFFDPVYSNIQMMLRNLPYQSTMGNHEKSGTLFAKYFSYPFVDNRYWSFDYGPAHFVVVDQYKNYYPGSAQYQWLENDLATCTKPWKFIYLHEPGWSAGNHGNNMNVQNYIQPLCEEYGVPILFAGHNHYYSRAIVNGVQHITTGGGGAPLSQPDSTYPNIVASAMAYHFCKVTINGNWLNFETVNSGGSVIDSFNVFQPLTGWGTIEGYVTDINTGAGLEAMVTVINRTPQLSTTCGLDGYYSMVVPQDTIWEFVCEYNEDYLPDTAFASTAEHDTTTLDFTLRRSTAVSIDMRPDSYPVYTTQGGYFDFTGVLYNNTDQQQYTDVWIMLIIPTGNWYGPIQQWYNIPLAPNDSLVDPNTRQYIPWYALVGEYDYYAYCGDYPSLKMDSTWFDFLIFPGFGEWINDWNVSNWFSDGETTLPPRTGLCGNFPNPFNASTTISFDLAQIGDVNLSVYNLIGQEVETLIDNQVEAGNHNINWDASTYSSGIYFYKLTTEGKTFTKRMTLLK
ncbi:MAG: T9SS type A sorting domain-containing protein [candidate division Zixibacteria bacterium]|nr:T9SS type A sorting domain-containing protein [candidate division Zixibacteria bacterium]